MEAIIAAIITSIICFLFHLIVISTGIIKINPNWSIKKLKRHAQLLLTIWILFLPIFWYIYDTIGIRLPVPDITFQFIWGIFLFAALFFVYLTFYYVVDRSVSTRLMLEIDASPAKQLSYEKIRVVYNLDTKYQNELKGMKEGGFIKKEGEFYSNTLKGTIVAKGTMLYKKVFRLGKGG